MLGRRLIRQLQAENDALREALAYYADVRHWQRRGANSRGEPRRWIKSRLAVDRGDRARRALAAVPPGQPRQPLLKRLRQLMRPKAKRPLPRPTVPEPINDPHTIAYADALTQAQNACTAANAQRAPR